MDNMYQIAAKEGIIVEEFPFTAPLGGIYIFQEGRQPLIGISSNIETTAEKRCVFAEELGHHFTSGYCSIPREFYNYAARVGISKMERKAMKWAAHYLVPDNDLLDALRDNIFTTWELAEHFNVTSDFMQFRMGLFDAHSIHIMQYD